MLIDAHAHLTMPHFASDRENIVRRASEAGVRFVFTVGTDLVSSREAVALSRKYASVYAVVGIHPHHVKDMSDDTVRHMEEVVQDSRVRAYGEIGLDFFRNLSPRETQIVAFRRQIHMARRFGLPIVIHDRNAHAEIIRILREEGGEKLKVVIHCFSGDVNMARECLGMGFYLSVPGTITFPQAHILREVVREIPLERLMIETDCPFLAPEPFRGKRNEPAYVAYTAKKIAEVKGISAEQVGQVTAQTALSFFGLESFQ